MTTKTENGSVRAEIARIDALLRDEFQRVYSEECHKDRWDLSGNGIAMWSGGEAARRVCARDDKYPLNVYQNIMTRNGFGFWAPGEREETEEAIAALAEKDR